MLVWTKDKDSSHWRVKPRHGISLTQFRRPPRAAPRQDTIGGGASVTYPLAMPTSPPPDFDEAPSLPDPYARRAEEGEPWFLPPPISMAGNGNDPPPAQSGTISAWMQAEAALAGRLARLAMRFGALDERLRRGPEGWRQRLALLEAAELCWFSGDRLGADRLGLWVALRLAGVQEDAAALSRAGWAARRLMSGPALGLGLAPDLAPDLGPAPDDVPGTDQDRPGAREGIVGFLGRQPGPGRAPDDGPGARMAGWSGLMRAAADLHPISQACLAYHAWPMSDETGPGPRNDRLEAAVTAARLGAAEARGGGRGGAVFLPLALAGPAALRPGGAPEARLARWCDGAEQAVLAALRRIDRLEAWHDRARRTTAGLSGRTPPLLLATLADWPLVSAPMAEQLTGASRAAVQRNLAWLEGAGLIREVTGQGRFRFWAIRD